MEEQKKKSLSEISHLFLSSVRDNATGGMRPRRIPPGADRPISGATGTRLGIPPTSRTAMSIDLTPDEYARAVSAEENDNAAEPRRMAPLPPSSARNSTASNSSGPKNMPGIWPAQVSALV